MLDLRKVAYNPIIFFVHYRLATETRRNSYNFPCLGGNQPDFILVYQ
jgi:hypothetical protein